ncbi:hypothetical protein ES708_31625 [subsurface metagenome]
MCRLCKHALQLIQKIKPGFVPRDLLHSLLCPFPFQKQFHDYAALIQQSYQELLFDLWNRSEHIPLFQSLTILCNMVYCRRRVSGQSIPPFPVHSKLKYMVKQMDG